MNSGSHYHGDSSVDDESIDRFFGFFVAGFLLLLSLAPLIKGREVRMWLLFPSVILISLSLLTPRVLAPLRKIWVRFGMQLQKITQPLILGIVYYGVFTPMGIFMRAFGKNLLWLKKSTGVTSYWIRRDIHQSADMKNQY